MTKQRVLWTACPHGKAADGKLRVSVHVGPQLFPTGNEVSTLAEFPDWKDWPATKVTFKVKIGSYTYDAEHRERGPLVVPLAGALSPVDPGRALRVLEPDRLAALQLPGRVRPAVLPEHLHGPREHGAGRGLPASTSSRATPASVCCRLTAGSCSTRSKR